MQNELNELRNQVRTLKRMLFGMFGLVVAGCLLASTSPQSVPDVIQAKKFEVVNSKGQTLVLLGENKAGGFLQIQSDGARASYNSRRILKEEQSLRTTVKGRL